MPAGHAPRWRDPGQHVPERRGPPRQGGRGGVLEQFGYQRPGWYRTFKDHVAARTGDADAFALAATAAGLAGARVDCLEVEAGLDNPELAVEWRLNMPHTISFVAGLDSRTEAALRARATAALSAGLPSSVPMLALRAHAT